MLKKAGELANDPILNPQFRNNLTFLNISNKWKKVIFHPILKLSNLAPTGFQNLKCKSQHLGVLQSSGVVLDSNETHLRWTEFS